MRSQSTLDPSSAWSRTSAKLELESVRRVHRGGFVAIDSVSLAVEPGERIAIVGPSGSGKTTLLRMIAGLDPLDSGEIRIDGASVKNRLPHQRDLGLVFQDPALYPHLSVFQNIAFGLKRTRLTKVETRERVFEMASELGIEDCLDRRPRALSGGERGRVALARALVRRPRLLLLDEPLAHLDPHLRAAARTALNQLHARHAITTLLVTHDQHEAMAMGDRIVVLRAGAIVQTGSPIELYQRPKHRFVARFVGDPPSNMLSCMIVDDSSGSRRVELPAEGTNPPLTLLDRVRDADIWPTVLDRVPIGSIELGFRVEKAAILADDDKMRTEARIRLAATVVQVEPRGYESLITVDVRGWRISALLDSRAELANSPAGKPITIDISATDLKWFDVKTESVYL